MAVKFSSLKMLNTLVFAAVCLASCTKTAPPAPTPAVATTGTFNFSDEKPDPELDTVLALTPFSKTTHELWKGMRNEISGELNLKTVELSPSLSIEKLGKILEREEPSCVVLIGNRSAQIYGKLQRSGAVTPPSVILMASFAGHTISQLKNSTGIAYEVPGVTSFVALRRLFERPIRRIGVIYRPSLQRFVDEQAELATMENVKVVARRIDGKPSSRKIRLALSQLLDRDDVDALWVLNDNTLLSQANIRQGWLPELKGAEVPVLVGVASLVNVELQFGSVAVVPDHGALGVQAANVIFDLWDENWAVENGRIELPLSVQTVVDMEQADRFKLLPEAKASIDRTVF